MFQCPESQSKKNAHTHTGNLLYLVWRICSTTHWTCSQWLQPSTSKDMHPNVASTWRRLRSSGAVNLAAVDTHTRITVAMASIMLMHFPSSTLASALSSCTNCCCCCCNSSLLRRVWHASNASCRDERGTHGETHKEKCQTHTNKWKTQKVRFHRNRKVWWCLNLTTHQHLKTSINRMKRLFNFRFLSDHADSSML